jgi:hypothetical protein
MFSNHDNLGMIWKYYLSLIYLILEKLLNFYHIVFLFVFTLNRTYDFLDKFFYNFLKKV